MNEAAHSSADRAARARQILEERARRLAEPAAAPNLGAAIQVVRFQLVGESYALEAAFLHDVFRLTELAPLPGAASSAFGVTVWRGTLLHIVDLRQLLGLATPGLTDLSRVLVLGGERPQFGVLADAVTNLTAIPLAAIREPAEGITARREYLRGITPDALIVLDAAAILRLHDHRRESE